MQIDRLFGIIYILLDKKKVTSKELAELFEVSSRTIKSAILDRRGISFSYSSAKGQQTSREVEPLKLCFKNSAWYLYGYCKSRCDFRFFKLRRIRDICVSEQNFKRKSPGQIFSNENVYLEECINLKLKLSEQMAYRVYDEFDSYEQQEDGSFIAEIKYPKGEWIFYHIASFGSQCEVLKPENVKNNVKAELQKTLTHYL